MKKFLKHTLAVLLVVCMMASIMAPVSAITEEGEPTQVSQTYNFNTAGMEYETYTAYASDSAIGTTRGLLEIGMEFDGGSWAFMGTTRNGSSSPFQVTASRTNGNLKSAGVCVVFKLFGIKYDGEYTFTVVTNGTSQNNNNIYICSKDATFAADTLKDDIATATNSKSETQLMGTLANDNTSGYSFTFDVTDYRNSDNSICIVFMGTGSGGSNFRLVSMTAATTVTESVEVPAAEVAVDYSVDYSHLIDGKGDLFAFDKYGEMMDAAYGDSINIKPYEHSTHTSGGTYFYSIYESYTNSSSGSSDLYKLTGDHNLMFNCQVGGWMAFQIKNPGAGTYTVDYNYNYYNTGMTDGADFYLIPLSVVEAAGGVEAAMTSEYMISQDVGLGSGTQNAAQTRTLSENVTITGTEDYIFVAKATLGKSDATTGSAYLSMNSVTLTSNAVYNDYASAAAAATSSFHIVKLVHNHEDNINVNGYTLDLNGYTVNGNVVATSGKVIDSTDGTGKITGNLTTNDVQRYLPLKSSEGWKIFKYLPLINENNTNRSDYSKSTVAVSGDYVLFWFDINFSNAEAYSLIASGTSGLTIGAAIYVDGELVTDDVVFNNTVISWATNDVPGNGGYAMGVAISNAELAGEGATISVKPIYESDAVFSGDLCIAHDYEVPTTEAE